MNVEYVFDSDVDFYAELNKIVTDSVKHEENNEMKKTCLITGEELVANSIKLQCGHHFNYIPLLQDVKNQKQRWFNGKYGINAGCDKTLNIGQIKCPFCRHVQNGLIPYIPELYETKLEGVNHPLKYCMYTNKCKYILKSGKNKGNKCDIKCNDKYCLKHNKLIEKKESKLTCNKPKIYCTAIIKSGPNKGKTCGCIAKYDNLCGKHKK